MTTPYGDLNTLFTPSSGGVPPLSWFQGIRTNFEILAKPPGCKVNRTAALALTTGTPTAISFTAADSRDTDAFHDTSTNPSRMTVPTGLGGIYAVSCNLAFDSNTTGVRQWFFRVNGSTIYNQYLVSPTTGGFGTDVGGYDEIALAAGDYMEIVAAQSSGGNLNVTGAATLTWRAFS